MKENNHFHPIFPLNHDHSPFNEQSENMTHLNHVFRVKQHTNSI